MLIKEFLPNPAGKDTESEYIKLFNNGPEAVLLNGWSLKDASGKIYKLSGSLDSEKELVLPYSQTKIALNNNGEQVFLYDGAGKLIDELSYSGQASEGQTIQRLATRKLATSELTQNQNLDDLVAGPLVAKVIFVDFLTAAILAGLGLYLILQIEKKLEIKLF